MPVVALLKLVVSLKYWVKCELHEQFWGLRIFSMCRKTSVQNDYRTFPKCIVHKNIFCHPHTLIPAPRSYCMFQRVPVKGFSPAHKTPPPLLRTHAVNYDDFFFWSFLGSSEGAVHPTCCRCKTHVFVGWFLFFGGVWWVRGVLVLHQHLSPVAVITETTD